MGHETGKSFRFEYFFCTVLLFLIVQITISILLNRLELEHLEREKRERELRELRERELNDRLKEELMKNAGVAGAPGTRMPTPLDPHWLELHRRYGGLPGGPPPQFGLYPSPGHPG